MREISGIYSIVSRRTLHHRLLVDREKFPLSACSACTNYTDGSGWCSKPRYRQRTSHFPPDRSTVASTFLISSSARAREGCPAPRTQTSNSTAKGQCYYRSYTSHNTAECDTLEYAQHGQSSQCQQGNGMPDMATAQSQTTSGRDIQAQQRQAIRRETSRHRRPVSQPAGQGAGFMCRREEPDSSTRPNAASVTATSRHPGTSNPRLHSAWDNNVICRFKHDRRQGHRRLHAQTPASRIYPVLATHKCQNSAGFGFASYRRQLRSSQTPTSIVVAQAPSPVPFTLHSDVQFVAQYGGTMVPGNYRQTYPPWIIQKRSGFNQSNYAVSRKSQPESTRFYLERICRTDHDKDRQM